MCYDGILEPLGESQVVAYLELLADNYTIHLISFEKPADAAQLHLVNLMEQRLNAAGIVWYQRRYHKRPRIVSTLWDMGGAILLAVWLTIRHQARILHARSVLCAAMLYPARIIGRAKFVVDIRGFWADERVDAGLIPAGGTVFRVLKVIEKRMLRSADHIVTLTHASVPYLRDDERFGHSKAPISVIPTCADLDLFSSNESQPFKPDDAPLTIGYVGQIGTWYMLEEMLAFFAAVRCLRPDAQLLFINKNQQKAVREGVRQLGIDPAAVEIRSATRDEMPAQIRRMDAGMALIRPYFSKIASAPTKLAEYLGCGVPVVGNTGCGDMVRIIEDEGVGVAMVDTRPETINAAAIALLERLKDPMLRGRCTASAHRHFLLTDGATRYRAIYHALSGGRATDGVA